MPSPVPTPVAAAIGLVPTFFGGVRRLPGRAVRLPVYAVGHVLTTVGSAKREYDALAVRGEQLISKLRGTSFDEVEDAVEDALDGTPFAKPYDVVEDALEDAGEAVTQLVRSGRKRARTATGTAVSTAQRAAGAAGSTAQAAAGAAGTTAERTADAAGTTAERAADAAGTTAERAADAAATTAEQATGAVGGTVAAAGQAAAQVADSIAEGAATATRAVGNATGQAAEALADGVEAAADAVQPDDQPTAGEGAAASAGSGGTAAGADDVDLPATGPLEVETAVLAGLDLSPDSPLADLDAGAGAGVDDRADVPDAEAPKGVPTPKATEPDSTRVDTAASSEVVEVVERVSANVGGPVLAHDELPLPDYDHMTLGSLRGRMRSLDLPQLIQIRVYEKAHADRLPIVTMLDNRIAKLANDPTAPLSGSSPADAADAPAKGKRAKGGSKVKPATSHDLASSPDIAFGGLGGPHRGD